MVWLDIMGLTWVKLGIDGRVVAKLGTVPLSLRETKGLIKACKMVRGYDEKKA